MPLLEWLKLLLLLAVMGIPIYFLLIPVHG